MTAPLGAAVPVPEASVRSIRPSSRSAGAPSLSRGYAASLLTTSDALALLID